MDSPNLFSEPLYSPFLNEYIHDVPFNGDSWLSPLPIDNIGADDDMGWMEIYTMGSSGAVPKVVINRESSSGQVETMLKSQIMNNNTNSSFMDPLLVNQKPHGQQIHFPVGSSDHVNHAFGINGQTLAVQGGIGNTDYMGMMNNGCEAAMGSGMIISSPNFSPPTTPFISWEDTFLTSNQDLTNFVGNTLHVDNSHQLNLSRNNHCEIRLAEVYANMGNSTVNNRNIPVEHFPSNTTLSPQLKKGREEASTSFQAAINLDGGNVMNPLLSNFPNEPVELAPPADCRACQILKVITHQNVVGQNVMKLELHGSLVTTSFFHAIITNDTNQNQPIFQKLDFLNQNYDKVEQFLSHYLMERHQQGFTTTDDQHSRFYNILSMGSASSSVNTGGTGIDEAVPSNWNTPQKKSRKEQVKIVESLTMEKVRSVLHHRRADGAKLLGICVSSLSNFLKRRGKSDRSWPSRKIQSLLCRIKKARKRGEDIMSLQAKLDQLYAPFY